MQTASTPHSSEMSRDSRYKLATTINTIFGHNITRMNYVALPKVEVYSLAMLGIPYYY